MNVGMLKFRILGPLELSTDNGSVSLRSNRQRVVLAMLLLNANYVVPIDRLIEALWEHGPPTTAKSQVQTCVSALRQLLKNAETDSSITTWPTGYEIRVADAELDAAAFKSLVSSGLAAVAAGRPEDAVADLRSALGMWRGTAAADVESPTAQAAATRLNEDRMSALEDCIELELGLGRHHELIGELAALVKEYPLRERLRAHHMLALYRADRQVEALDSFREVRQLFIDELGVEPGKELCDLQQAILAREQLLEADASAGWLKPVARSQAETPQQLPAALANFTGRADTLEELAGILTPIAPDDAAVTYLPMVSLYGKGGVGKTALAVQAAHAVQDRYTDGQLFVHLHEGDGQPITAYELLGRFLRAFDIPAAAVPNTLDERVSAYRSLLASRRVLVVLDDAESASQLAPLIPGEPTSAVIVTSRNMMSSLEGARHFEITDLDEDTSTRLIGRLLGPERLAGQEAAARELARLCDRLPLALRIAAAKLLERPHWRIEQMVRRMTDESKRLDELAAAGAGIRATLSVTYRSLSIPMRRLLVRLSLIEAPDFAPWICAALLDTDPERADDLLDALIQAHLVEPQIGEHGEARFRLHDLVRIYAREQLAAEAPVTERAGVLERLLSCWLFLVREAHGRARGGDFGVLHGHAALWQLPEDVVARLLDKPLDWLRMEHAGLVSAIMQACRAGLDELCWDLAFTSVTLFELENQADDWRKTHEAALEVTRRARNERGEAAILYSLGNLEISERTGEASRYVGSALAIFDRLGDVHGRALAMSALATIDRICGRYDEAAKRYREALTGLQEAGDKLCEIDVLANLAQIEMDRENLPEAERLLSQAFLSCQGIEARRARAQTEFRLGEYYLQAKDLDRAEQSFNAVLQAARDEGDRVGEAFALAGLVATRTEQGQYRSAEAGLADALHLSRQLSDNLIHVRTSFYGAELYVAMGAADRALGLLNEALAALSDVGPVPIWRIRILDLKASIHEQAGRATIAAAARREAISLAGEADTVLAEVWTRRLASPPDAIAGGPGVSLLIGRCY
jgi:DNA-binding SARP family transcriptional activator